MRPSAGKGPEAIRSLRHTGRAIATGLLFLAVAASQPSAGQTPAGYPTPEMKERLIAAVERAREVPEMSAQWRSAIEAKVRDTDSRTWPNCKERQVASYTDLGSIIADAKVEVGVARGVIHNAWAGRANILSCGTERRYQFFVLEFADPQPDGSSPKSPFDVAVTLPGETRTWPSLNRDMASVLIQAALIPFFKEKHDCTPRNFTVLHTELRRDKGEEEELHARFGVVTNGQWSERWTVRVCEREVHLPVTFTARNGDTKFAFKEGYFPEKPGKP